MAIANASSIAMSLAINSGCIATNVPCISGVRMNRARCAPTTALLSLFTSVASLATVSRRKIRLNSLAMTIELTGMQAGSDKRGANGADDDAGVCTGPCRFV